MISPTRFGIVLTIAAVLAPGAGAQTGWPPDHTKANIDGKEGMLIFPRDEQGPIEPRNCVVQLAPMTALEKRFTYPCKEWFLPPAPGSYRCWVELEGRVSGAQTILSNYRDTAFQGSGWMITHETVTAGYVSVPQDVPPGHTVRYLSLDAPAFGFSLRVPAASASKAVPMPPGRVVAGIFREDKDEAVAHSRPMLVERGKMAEFRIDPPRTGSDLLVMLRKPPGSSAKADAAFHVRYATESREADVVRESPGWFIALWYGLPATTVTLSVDGAAFASPETAISLTAGKITTIRPQLEKAAGAAPGR